MSDFDVWRQVGGLVIVFGLLGIIVYASSKVRGMLALGGLRWSRPGKHMELLERLPVSPQHSLLLVRIAGRVFLVATHQSGATITPVENFAEAPSETVP